MNTPSFIVLIATCGGERLDCTLEALSKCKLPKGFREVIIVENGTKSTHVEDLVTGFTNSLRISYQFVEDGNKSNALNFALEGLIENHLVFFTDDDVLFDGEILLAYQQAAEETALNDEDVQVVFGGRVDADPEIPIPHELKTFLPSSHSGYPPENVDFNPKVHLFIGNNWTAYSDDIKSLGGFNPLFGPGSRAGASGQETDILIRMREANFKFQFVDDAIVKHWVEKERLTPEFVEGRKFKDGVQIGLRYKIKFAQQKPVWKQFGTMMRHRLRSLGGVIPRSISLKARMNASFSSGFLVGVSRANQHDA